MEMPEDTLGKSLKYIPIDSAPTITSHVLELMCTLHSFGVNRSSVMERGYEATLTLVREVRPGSFLLNTMPDVLVLFREAAFRWEADYGEGELS